MGSFKNKRLSTKGRYVICKCKKPVFIQHPSKLKNANGGMGVIISHAHCTDCCLEWHLTWGNKTYSHSYRPKYGSDKAK